MRASVTLYRAAFQDLVVTVEDQYEDGDIVISRGTISGTQTGELPGVSATGKRITIGGVQVDRYEGDKIAESWPYWDTLGMLQQLGAVPRPRPPASY
jgi:predicted ester cyclase